MATTLLPSTTTPKVQCTSALHDQFRAKPALWKLFKLEGYQPTYADEGEPQQLEQRRCMFCKSSLYVVVVDQVASTLAVTIREGE